MKREVTKIIKKKNKVLGIFQKTKNNLSKLISEINVESERCDKNIETLNNAIQDETQAKGALANEREMAEKTIKNIESIIGD